MTPLEFRISVREHRSRFPQPEAECSEEPLTLPHAQSHAPLLRNPMGQSLPVPRVRHDPVHSRGIPQNPCGGVELLAREARRPSLPGRLRQSAQSFRVETPDPVLDGPGGVSQIPRRLPRTEPLRDHQHGMQPVVVAGVLGSADLVLQNQGHHFGIFNFEGSHADTIRRPASMRNYLCRRV